MKFLGSLFIGLCFLIYALYCYQNGGSHHKGRGWVTKEEAPKTHIFQMILFIVIGIPMRDFFDFIVPTKFLHKEGDYSEEIKEKHARIDASRAERKESKGSKDTKRKS